MKSHELANALLQLPNFDIFVETGEFHNWEDPKIVIERPNVFGRNTMIILKGAE